MPFRPAGCEFSVDSHVPPGEGYYLRSGRVNVRCDVLTAMFQSIQAFWDATLWSLVSVSHKPSDKAQPPIIPESPRRLPQNFQGVPKAHFVYPETVNITLKILVAFFF